MKNRIRQVLNAIEFSAKQAGRDPSKIKLVGVSKRHPAEAIVEAVRNGLLNIGENRVQEAEEKLPVVKELLKREGLDYDAITWHMVGKLQTNKIARAVALFDVIQSVDSVKLAQKISSIAGDLGKTLDILVEVNVSGEISKAGIQPEGLSDLVGEIATLKNIRLNGLMTIGPLTDDKNLIRRSFDSLRELRTELEARFSASIIGEELSMGMSDDFPIAISTGATIIRIGTAIFGQRPPAINL